MKKTDIMKECKLFVRRLQDGQTYVRNKESKSELETIRYWNAKIVGKDPIYGLKRLFLFKKIFVNDFKDGDIIENVTGSARWREHNFYVVKNGKFVKFASGDKDMYTW